MNSRAECSLFLIFIFVSISSYVEARQTYIKLDAEREFFSNNFDSLRNNESIVDFETLDNHQLKLIKKVSELYLIPKEYHTCKLVYDDVPKTVIPVHTPKPHQLSPIENIKFRKLTCVDMVYPMYVRKHRTQNFFFGLYDEAKYEDLPGRLETGELRVVFMATLFHPE